jgi:hypothetical protein
MISMYLLTVSLLDRGAASRPSHSGRRTGRRRIDTSPEILFENTSTLPVICDILLHMRTIPAKTWAAGAAVVLGATLVPSTAFAAEGDTTISGDVYTEVVFDHAVKGWDGESWAAECPPEFPYLTTNHSESDGRVGYGLHISEETPSALHVVQGAWFGRRGPDWYKLENGAYAAVGNSGTVSNWSVVLQHLTIKMECTSNVAKAWLDSSALR